jgi:DNA-binding response OmpR family regulator
MSGGQYELHARFLVVEDDRLVATTLERLLRHFGRVTLASSVGQASAGFANCSPTAIVLDEGLPDGSGLDWLESIAAARRDPATLVVTASDDRDIERRAHRLGHAVLHKPFAHESIEHFARSSLAASHTSGRARDLVARVATAYRWGPCQTKILALAVARVPRKLQPEILRVSHDRLKKVIRMMVHDAGVFELDDLANEIVRSVVTWPRAEPSPGGGVARHGRAPGVARPTARSRTDAFCQGPSEGPAAAGRPLVDGRGVSAEWPAPRNRRDPWQM